MGSISNRMHKRKAAKIKLFAESDVCKICGTRMWTRLSAKDPYWLTHDPSGREATLDHIIPLSRGGPDADSNYQLLCRKCNFTKKDQL